MDWRADIKDLYGLDQEQISAFELLLSMLQRQNDRNLTAVTGAANIVRVHFLDSLWLINLPELASATEIVDIGSGAGFPGLPLAIALPAARISMIEAVKKKSDFIAAAAEALRLKNTAVLPFRAEEAGRSPLRESFDIATARAVGSVPEVLEYTLPLLKTGGYALLPRGAREDGDEKGAARAAAELGGFLSRIQPALPYPGARNLHIWVVEKVSPTPEKYPRRPGMAKKRPLGR